MYDKRNLYRQIVKSVGSKYATYAINLLSLAILSRIFSPTAYGVVGVALLVYVFFQLVLEGGVTPHIIGLDQLPAQERNQLFATLVGIGLVLALLLLLMAAPIARFYQAPMLVQVIPSIMLAITCFAATVLPLAHLLRECKFHLVSLAAVAAEVLSTLVAVLAQRHWDEAIALSFKTSAYSSVNFLCIYVFAGGTSFGRPALQTPTASTVVKLYHHTKHQFGFNIVNYFSRNIDNILVGKFFSLERLGIYDKAYQIMKYPLMLISFAISPAIQPVLKQHTDQPEIIERATRDLAFKLGLAGVAVGLLVYWLADWIVLLLLGPQWRETGQLLKLLSIGIPAQIILSTCGGIFQACRRTDLLLWTGIGNLILFLITVMLGLASAKLTMLCLYLSMAFNLALVFTYATLYRVHFRRSFMPFLGAVTPVLLSSAILALINIKS